jgi:23S rRNA (guanosine2251-2'-O)-methyltransferase
MRKLKLQELGRPDLNTFRKMEKLPIAIVLDNVRSGLNVGSAFRTGDAFAIQHIHLCGITAQPPHREILKTAIGATESVAWTHWETTVQAAEYLKSQNFQLVGVEQTDTSVPLQQISLPAEQQVALFFGNEVQGLSDDLLPLLDACVEIPQWGTKHSLNISVCLGIVVWEYVRKLNFSQ